MKLKSNKVTQKVKHEPAMVISILIIALTQLGSFVDLYDINSWSGLWASLPLIIQAIITRMFVSPVDTAANEQ